MPLTKDQKLYFAREGAWGRTPLVEERPGSGGMDPGGAGAGCCILPPTGGVTGGCGGCIRERGMMVCWFETAGPAAMAALPKGTCIPEFGACPELAARRSVRLGFDALGMGLSAALLVWCEPCAFLGSAGLAKLE
ncbi:hypothetical protein PG996_014903 [Apiospora saccharicola]|uniref:Uncharacterized protein n=1 Tax=Apiospora saccharicola TaxID=335842 RepID=A0ABR1TJN1_9PEZI